MGLSGFAFPPVLYHQNRSRSTLVIDSIAQIGSVGEEDFSKKNILRHNNEFYWVLTYETKMQNLYEKMATFARLIFFKLKAPKP